MIPPGTSPQQQAIGEPPVPTGPMTSPDPKNSATLGDASASSVPGRGRPAAAAPMFVRVAGVLAAFWAGMLACIALLAAPTAFASLAGAEAGRFVGRLFAQEAPLSLGLALLLVFMERRRASESAEETGSSVFSAELMLLFGTVFCTVAGYYALQPMMASARLGQGTWSFGTLHAASLAFYGLKGVLVLALAWRLSRY